MAFVHSSPTITLYHDPVVGLVDLLYYAPLVDGVDANVFFELVVFFSGDGVVVVVE